MIFGIPRELKDHETRVGAGLIPRNVATLIAQGLFPEGRYGARRCFR